MVAVVVAVLLGIQWRLCNKLRNCITGPSSDVGRLSVTIATGNISN